MRRLKSVLGVLACLFAVGCYQEIPLDDPDGSPPPWDAAAFPDAGPPMDAVFVPPPGKCVQPAGVDLLLAVDSSNSMTEEQASLAAELPALVRSLSMPPDRDGDGVSDWLPVTDLHVGVVNVDLGTGGHLVPTCTSSDFGDDGVLRTVGMTEIAGCMATYPTFLEFDPTVDSPDAFAREVGCVAQVGTGGCGFEQQLESVLKALSPAAATRYTGPGYAPPTFFRGTSGHGDGANAGFVRDDSLLAIVIVSDEEDCSAADPELFNPESPRYGATDLNLRCSQHAAEALHPVERYVDGFASLRADRPDLLALGLIVGVPVDLTLDEPTDADFAAVLADPRMQEQLDPSMPSRLLPSCNVVGRGLAFPPRRLVSVARELTGHRTTVQSICQEDFSPASAAIARLFGTRACTAHME